MNYLAITGKIHFNPIFEQKGKRKVVKLTIMAVDEHSEPQMATILKLRWKDPPDKYWRSPDLVPGTLIFAEGPLHGFVAKNPNPILDRTPYQEILYFKILNSQKDYLEMRARAIEKSSKKKDS